MVDKLAPLGGLILATVAIGAVLYGLARRAGKWMGPAESGHGGA